MHFLRLIRPVNLIVIAIIMYSLRFYFFKNESEPFNCLFSLDYFLLVFSTVIIAAAGNCINDYFDQKADKINKPKKVIVGKFIKPRIAIVIHWSLNFIAFSIAVYLSWKFRTFWYLFIHLLSINLLWLYSMKLKRKFLIGNIVISLLTALVPVLAGIFLMEETNSIQGKVNDFISQKEMNYLVLIVFSCFAFILNFIREIVKDIEDIEGDKYIHAKTFAIQFGEKKARFTSIGLIVLVLFCSVFSLYSLTSTYFLSIRLIDVIVFCCIATCLLLSLFFLTKTSRKDLKIADRFLKVAMIIGALLPFIWSNIISKG